MRLGAISIALCMVMIAGFAGACVHLYLGAGIREAVMVAAATLAALVLYQMVSSRIGLPSPASRQLADMARGGADLARQVAEMGHRLAALEGKIATAIDRTRAVTDPLLEIEELGMLVKQLAETVASQQTAIEAIGRNSPKSQATLPGALACEPLVAVTPTPDQGAPFADAADQGGAAAAGGTADLVLTTIRSAIEANRLELYLQPIVTLPHRKVRYYEATSRLRSEAGEILHACDFVALAESSGLMPKIDNLAIFRCVSIVRRLALKNRDIGVFCSLSQATLADASAFAQVRDFMAANRALAPSLVLQFTHAAVRAMGAVEHESLAALSEHGFRFAMNHVASLRLEPGELAERGFRYIHVHADLMLKKAAPIPSDIHPADLSDLLGRFGIDLIVEGIEHESSVIELLDRDVRYGQGSLFSPPRPVRPEALQAMPDFPDAVARERISAPDQLAPAGARAPNATVHSPEPDDAGQGPAAQIAGGVPARG